MKLKTFLCKSMDEALSTIRREMGPDAMIISSINDGQNIRITAACENSSYNQPSQPEPPVAKVNALSTKNLFCRILTYHAVPTILTDKMIAEFCNLPREVLEGGIPDVLMHLLPITKFDLKSPTSIPRQIMVAGPAGSGKTVSVAKLASEFCLLNQKVFIISADHLKSGAKEQIQLYAQALQAPVKFVDSAQALEKALKDIPSEHTVLIDTPGTNPLNHNDLSYLTEFILASKQPPLLVLSAGGDSLEMQESALAFKEVGCTKMLMTRIDATRRFGGMLSILFKERLELFAIGLGPEIGNRLRAASPKNIAEILQFYLPPIADKKITTPLNNNIVSVHLNKNKAASGNDATERKYTMEKRS